LALDRKDPAVGLNALQVASTIELGNIVPSSIVKWVDRVASRRSCAILTQNFQRKCGESHKEQEKKKDPRDGGTVDLTRNGD
jgi:hypothetical protein